MIMRTILFILLCASVAFAEGLPSCPDGGADPSKFCPVGMIWNEASRTCVAMV